MFGKGSRTVVLSLKDRAMDNFEKFTRKKKKFNREWGEPESRREKWGKKDLRAKRRQKQAKRDELTKPTGNDGE